MAEKSAVLVTPGLNSYLRSLKQRPVEASIQDLISLLKRRQIRSSKPCAIATAKLMRRVVTENRVSDGQALIKRVAEVGRQLTAAQPREIAVGNVVRRVLGVIREEVGEERKGRSETFSETATDSVPETPAEVTNSRQGLSPLSRSLELPPRSPILDSDEAGALPTESSFRPSLMGSHMSYATAGSTAQMTSMFSLLSHPVSSTASPIDSPRPDGHSPTEQSRLTKSSLASLESKDLRAGVLEGIEEIIEELNVVDDQIAGYATEHIHSNEIIMTYGPSTSVQKFLLQAARKRKFTVIHAEAFPNNHHETHQTIVGKRSDPASSDELDTDSFTKPLIAVGVTVVLIPDAAIFALMSRVNKAILGTHVVLANGGLVAAAGAKLLARAANVHRVPVVVLSGVYKLSPIYPYDIDALIEHGDPGNVLNIADDDLHDKVEVENPLYDYVPPELVDLYITNLGGHAPTYLYRIVADHYSAEDTDLAEVE